MRFRNDSQHFAVADRRRAVVELSRVFDGKPHEDEHGNPLGKIGDFF